MSKNELEKLKPHASSTKLAEASSAFRVGLVGDASGIATDNYQEAQRLINDGYRAILVLRGNYKPEWLYQVKNVYGIIIDGKPSSHIPIILQNMGIPAVIGLQTGELPKNGQQITICSGNGANEHGGIIANGAERIVQSDYFYPNNSSANIKRFANASSAIEARNAVRLGAQGIGLVRTEHFVNNADDLQNFQSLLAEENPSTEILEKFHDIQYRELRAILSELTGKNDFPVYVRLIDPPYEELLEGTGKTDFEKQFAETERRGIQLTNKIANLSQTQILSILGAAKKSSFTGEIRIVVPHVENAGELQKIKQLIQSCNSDIQYSGNVKIVAAIESKKGAKNTAEIAKNADGILVAMNDLTAEVIGCSRDDEPSIKAWMEQNKEVKNPFQALCKPVRDIVEKLAKDAREANNRIIISTPSAQISGDLDSINFCLGLGFDSISLPATDFAQAQANSIIRASSATNKLSI